MLAPDGKAPAYVRFIVERRAAPRARPHAVALDPERVHLRAWTLVRAQRRRAVAAIIPLAFALIGRAGTDAIMGSPLCKQRDSRRGTALVLQPGIVMVHHHS